MQRLARRTAMMAMAGALGIAVAIGSVGTETVGADIGIMAATTCPAPQSNQGGLTLAGPTRGTIATISGATLTLNRQDNSMITVATDGNTRFNKAVASSVSAIATGDFVLAQGTTSGTNFAATTIIDNGAQAQPQGGNAQGSPGGPGGNGQTLASANGTPPAQQDGCMPAQGQQLPQGQPQPGQQPSQGQPQQGQQGQPPSGNPNGASDGTSIMGTVQQVSGTTLTLTTADGKTLAVTTDGTTKVSTSQQGALTDLQVGDQVDAMADPQSGAQSNATSFTATMISDRTAH